MVTSSRFQRAGAVVQHLDPGTCSGEPHLDDGPWRGRLRVRVAAVAVAAAFVAPWRPRVRLRHNPGPGQGHSHVRRWPHPWEQLIGVATVILAGVAGGSGLSLTRTLGAAAAISGAALVGAVAIVNGVAFAITWRSVGRAGPGRWLRLTDPQWPGALAVARLEDRGDAWHLHDLAAWPPRRQPMSLGACLLDAIQAQTRTQGRTLTLTAGNRRLVRFYQACGFEVLSNRCWYVPMRWPAGGIMGCPAGSEAAQPECSSPGRLRRWTGGLVGVGRIGRRLIGLCRRDRRSRWWCTRRNAGAR